jgi:hypothetical protein
MDKKCQDGGGCDNPAAFAYTWTDGTTYYGCVRHAYAAQFALQQMGRAGELVPVELAEREGEAAPAAVLALVQEFGMNLRPGLPIAVLRDVLWKAYNAGYRDGVGLPGVSGGPIAPPFPGLGEGEHEPHN